MDRSNAVALVIPDGFAPVPILDSEPPDFTGLVRFDRDGEPILPEGDRPSDPAAPVKWGLQQRREWFCEVSAAAGDMGSALRVASYMSLASNYAGEVCVGVEKLSKNLGMPARTVTDGRSWLADRGFIEHVGWRSRAKVWKLTMAAQRSDYGGGT